MSTEQINKYEKKNNKSWTFHRNSNITLETKEEEMKTCVKTIHTKKKLPLKLGVGSKKVCGGWIHWNIKDLKMFNKNVEKKEITKTLKN